MQNLPRSSSFFLAPTIPALLISLMFASCGSKQSPTSGVASEAPLDIKGRQYSVDLRPEFFDCRDSDPLCNAFRTGGVTEQYRHSIQHYYNIGEGPVSSPYTDGVSPEYYAQALETVLPIDPRYPALLWDGKFLGMRDGGPVLETEVRDRGSFESYLSVLPLNLVAKLIPTFGEKRKIATASATIRIKSFSSEGSYVALNMICSGRGEEKTFSATEQTVHALEPTDVNIALQSEAFTYNDCPFGLVLHFYVGGYSSVNIKSLKHMIADAE